MRKLLCLLLILFATEFAVLHSEAAPVVPVAPVAQPATRVTVWMQAIVTAPVWSDDALSVTLRPDEAACHKAYGDDWRERCRYAPGREGAPVAGVHITPALPGQWRWNDDNVMRFTPSIPWPANTKYAISLDGLSVPAHVRLPRQLTASTQPLAARIEKGQVWIDSDITGERALSFDIRFTTPPARAQLEKALVLRPAGQSTLGLAPTHYIWNADGTRCLVKARITALPGNDVALELRLPGVRGLVQNNTIWTATKGDALASVTVPSKDSLFVIKKTNLVQEKNELLQDEYHLTLETSIRVSPAALARELRILELPKTQNPEASQPYEWTRAPRITAEDLNKSKEIKATLLPGANGDMPVGKVTLRVPATQDAYIYVWLPQGFGPAKDMGLAQTWASVFHAVRTKPSLAFAQLGNVLALSGTRKLDIVSTGLDAIRWRVVRVLPAHLGLLASWDEGTSLFDNEHLRNTIDKYGDAVEGILPVQQAPLGQPQFAVLDLAPVLQGEKHLLYVELTPMIDGKESGDSESRLVLVTDLGTVIKKAADGSRQVFVCSLSRGAPLANALAQVIGANGLPVAEARTDAAGRALLPPVDGLKREKKPAAIVVRYEAGGQHDIAWLSLDDHSRKLDYSRYATQGQIGAENGLSAYIFPQRGIFRPGETLHFGAIVRHGSWKPLPADLPLTVVLTGPSGREILQTMRVADANGMIAVDYPLSEYAPTGRYRLEVRMQGAEKDAPLVLGSGSTLVAEFQPDTMLIEATIEPAPAKGWLMADKANALARLLNLYGLPATDRRVRGQLSVAQGALVFAGYEGYVFHDAEPYKGEALTLDLAEVRTDVEGRATVPLGLEKLRAGTVDCSVLLEGFEPNEGRAVSIAKQFIVSPMRVALGYKPSGPGTNLSFIPKDQETYLEFIAVDPNLARTVTGPLTFSVAQRRYVTSLVTDKDGRFRYDETPVDQDVVSQTHSLEANDPLRWRVPTRQPGEYLLTVRGADAQIMARLSFTVAGNDDPRQVLWQNLPSSVLRMQLDKEDYNPGDVIQLFLSTPYDGLGLISLERNDVVSHQWFTAKAGNSVQTLTVPKDFEGRGYVNVSFARGQSSPEIFMEPHSFAVRPITVNVARRSMGLTVVAPATPVLPGQNITATVTAKTPGKAFIFAVDEGVLQLTKFATPDPLYSLILDRALEVSTAQMFDLLMADHARLAGRIPAFGGDGNLAGGRFQNPFKRKHEPPVAFWGGLTDVGPQGTTVTIPVPDYYNGRVRIMVVGASPDTAGYANADATVRAPLILTPQFPVLAAPGDTFEAALAIADTTVGGQPRTFTLAMDADKALTLNGAVPSRVTLQPGKDMLLPLPFTAGDTLGNTEVHFTLTDEQGHAVRRTATLSLRPASALREHRSTGKTTQSVTLPVQRQIYPWQAKGSASVSATPLPAVRGLLRYLNAYPWHCTEQSVSRALPLAVLLRHSALLEALGDGSTLHHKETDRILAEAIGAVQAAFLDEYQGGVTPWPGMEKPDPLLTVYAADFLMAVREAGLTVPGALLERLLDRIYQTVSDNPDDMRMATAHAWGIWLLTRDGRITTQKIETLTKYLNSNLENWQREMPAVFLAGSYAIMRMDAQATGLIEGIVPSKLAIQGDFLYSPPAALALYTSVLARHFPNKLRDTGDALAQMLTESVTSRSNTFVSALGIRALIDLAGGTNVTTADKALHGVTLTCTQNQPDFEPVQATSQNAGGHAGSLLTLNAPGCMAYTLTVPAGHTIPLYWEVSNQGYDRIPPKGSAANSMEVSRVYLDAGGQAVTSVAQGEVLLVKITARATGEALENAVIVDLIPGGFEIVLPKPGLPLMDTDARVEQREDRMVIFADLETKPSEYVYRIRAVNKGRYSVPPVQGEGMYQRSANAYSGGGVMQIK